MNAATASDIRGWLEEAQAEGATHLLIVCDDFSYEDYPVQVMPHEDVHEREAHYRESSMQRVMEVYSLTGKYTIDEQMNELRAFHRD